MHTCHRAQGWRPPRLSDGVSLQRVGTERGYSSWVPFAGFRIWPSNPLLRSSCAISEPPVLPQAVPCMLPVLGEETSLLLGAGGRRVTAAEHQLLVQISWVGKAPGASLLGRTMGSISPKPGTNSSFRRLLDKGWTQGEAGGLRPQS